MPVTLPPFYVNAPPVQNIGFGVFDFNQGFDPETYGFDTNIFQGGMGLGDTQENTGEVVTLPPFVVTGDRIETNPPITGPFDGAEEIIIDGGGGGGGGEINTGPVVTLTSFVVTADRIQTNPPIIVTLDENQDTIDTGGGGGGGEINTGQVVTLTPFIVTADRFSTPPVIIDTGVNIFTPPPVVTDGTESPDVVTLTPFIVTDYRINTPTPSVATPVITFDGNETTPPVVGTKEIITLPPFIVTDIKFTPPVITFDTESITFETDEATRFTPLTTPTSSITPTPSPTPPIPTPEPTPTPTGIFGGGGGGGTSTGTMSAQRDFDAELRDTLKSLQKYQPEIQRMYGDLYQQFMPKGLTAAEPGIINQYQADLARLQQRQAGMLSPEDIRQSQQSAREAYGARGQVMGPGAIGAEILNREAIRQQREDQARAALQASYGNILNMANLQTGNLFSPIGSLMSSTFNPLGAYPADVYGTNVNAQLARDIAQKNYEAAIRSAELSGAAQKQAGTTSLLGDIFGTAIPEIFRRLCWVAREVYGEDNPKWMQFREWLMSRSPSWFFKFYLENGERIAAWLKRNPWAKSPIRMWMDSRIRSMEKRELVLKEAV